MMEWTGISTWPEPCTFNLQEVPWREKETYIHPDFESLHAWPQEGRTFFVQPVDEIERAA